MKQKTKLTAAKITEKTGTSNTFIPAPVANRWVSIRAQVMPAHPLPIKVENITNPPELIASPSVAPKAGASSAAKNASQLVFGLLGE